MSEMELTAEMAEKWFDALGKHRFKEYPGETPSYPIEAFFAAATPTGLILTMVLPGGDRVHMSVNAVLALRLRQIVDACGKKAGWMGDVDNLIVETPSGPAPWRPQH